MVKFTWGRDVNIYLQRVNSSRLYFLKMAQFLPFHGLLYTDLTTLSGECDCVPSLGSGLWLWWNWNHVALEAGWRSGSLGNFAFGIQLPCHEEARAACGQACMGRTKGIWLSFNFQPAPTSPATWMSLLKSESYSPELGLQLKQNGNKDELLLLEDNAHVTDSVNKINDCCCYEPLNLEVVCYTAVDNDTIKHHPYWVSLTICVKIAIHILFCQTSHGNGF